MTGAARTPFTLASLGLHLSVAGLQPIVDHAMNVVRAICPACTAAQDDPLGLYRPFVALITGAAYCAACGERRDV